MSKIFLTILILSQLLVFHNFALAQVTGENGKYFEAGKDTTINEASNFILRALPVDSHFSQKSEGFVIEGFIDSIRSISEHGCHYEVVKKYKKNANRSAEKKYPYKYKSYSRSSGYVIERIRFSDVLSIELWENARGYYGLELKVRHEYKVVENSKICVSRPFTGEKYSKKEYKRQYEKSVKKMNCSNTIHTHNFINKSIGTRDTINFAQKNNKRAKSLKRAMDFITEKCGGGNRF